MKKIAPKGPLLRGLDISSWQGFTDFRNLKLSGVEFVICKCDEYTVDNQYYRNKGQALAAGILFGAYHFFHPNVDPVMQANHFISRAQLGKGNMIPILDWESTDGLPTASDVIAAKTWLDIVEKQFGRPPMIYGSPYFLDGMKLTSDWLKYPLWIANYRVSAPLVPSPWDKETFAFWQNDDSGHFQGIPSPKVDLDVFNGTYDDLQRLVL